MRSKIFGILLLFESFFMLLSSMVAWYYNMKLGETDLNSLLISTGVTGLVGLILYFFGLKSKRVLGIKDSFLIVTLSWVLFSLFGMIPFLLYGTVNNVSDAFFETMSGFTTTGATILNNIDEQPHGILFWRSVMQWLGGLGIVVFSLAFIPTVGRGSKKMFLFAAESTGLSVEKLRPKMQGTARDLWLIYIALTVSCMVMYWMGPMSFFDAVCHGLTTLATGGFSTHQASIGYYNSAYIEYVCSFFMILAGINFSMYYFMITRRSELIWKNEEFRTYLFIVFFMIALFVSLFYITPMMKNTTAAQLASLPEGGENIFRTSLFHVATILSSTGYQGHCYDYDLWGLYFIVPTLFMMACGGCAGSTGGGIKVIRVMVLFKYIRNAFKEFFHPSAMFSVKISNHVVESNVVLKVGVFFFLYFLLFAISVALLTLTGVPFEESVFAYITCLGNCGPGLHGTGPSSNFAWLPGAAKWILSILMLIGRLEIFTVLLLFSKSFWKAK